MTQSRWSLAGAVVLFTAITLGPAVAFAQGKTVKIRLQ